MGNHSCAGAIALKNFLKGMETAHRKAIVLSTAPPQKLP